MPLVSMRQLLDEAAKSGYGVGAFNVNNMEQIQAIMEAARETRSPVIIQASRGARAYSPTWGVPVEEIQLGIRNGVRKVNVDTDNRLAITGAIRKVFMEKPEEFDPRSYMKPARDAMKKVVAQRMVQFGQAGHAGDYEPIPLSEMAAQYASQSCVTV
jgi:fructose/tagatose bisphosphate aldolase